MNEVAADPLIEVLLVEDTPEDVELTLEALGGYIPVSRIRVARDGLEALQYLHGADGEDGAAAAGNLPRVVLLDLKLPKVDGLEVLERIRTDPRTELLPVVLLTSSAEETDMHRAYKLHANSYIAKPVQFDEFATVLREIGVYWLSMNRAPTRPASRQP